MAAETKIQWARHTLNFWWGCTKVSEACAFCYAMMLDLMRGPLFDNGNTHWGPSAPRWLRLARAIAEAKKFNRAAEREGDRPRVFVNSMSDTFEAHPSLPAARDALFATIEPLTACSWLLLTKRPENILAMVPAHWRTRWPAHVWIGTTVENQARAEERLRLLLAVPAQVRFLSCEPLLGPVDLTAAIQRHCVNEFICGPAECECASLRGIHWVICGGESGSQARDFDIGWARDLRDQCKAAGVPFFMKQLGTKPIIDNRDMVPKQPEDADEEDVEDFVRSFIQPLRLKDQHGGNWDEWHEDLRVREVPAV